MKGRRVKSIEINFRLRRVRVHNAQYFDRGSPPVSTVYK